MFLEFVALDNRRNILWSTRGQNAENSLSPVDGDYIDGFQFRAAEHRRHYHSLVDNSSLLYGDLADNKT